MPEFCTCGAQLPPDALFCHKCGKPQRELPQPEIASEPVEFVPPAPPPRPQPAPLNFHNRVAVRIALLVALAATVLSFVPYLNWLAAGYFAVFFYRRRTGYPVNVGAGVRMGWITGLMMFTMLALLFTAFLLLLNAAGGIAGFQQQFRNAADPRVLDMLKMLQNGSEVASLLVQFFIFTTCLSMAGGALGAKILGRGR